MRVLIADDNSEIRSALGLVLRELWPDCEVENARDGAEALCLLESRGADLVLLDWELPGIHAPRFTRDLCTRFSACPVIAMSSDPEAREQSLAAGAAYFVGTSDPPQRLLGLLRSLGSPAPSGSRAEV